jgi:hypothetical protein
MEYMPTPLVVAERVFSMSAGLDASTVTPGARLPTHPFTVTDNRACANASWGNRDSQNDQEGLRQPIHGPPPSGMPTERLTVDFSGVSEGLSGLKYMFRFD